MTEDGWSIMDHEREEARDAARAYTGPLTRDDRPTRAEAAWDEYRDEPCEREEEE